MSKYLFSILLLIGLFPSCKKKPEDVVKDVNKTSDKINKQLKDYKSKRVDDLSSKALGSITGYYRDAEVRKIYAEHFTDTNRVFDEYYFDDGMLILVLEQNFRYNCSDTLTEEKARANHDSVWYDDKKTRLEITRFYLNKNKLVKWILPGGKEMSPTSTEFIEREPMLWAQAALLIKELKEEDN